MIFNSHTHLNSTLYNETDIVSILNECKAKNIELLVCGYDLQTSLKAVKLANDYDFVYAAVGIHPSEVKKTNLEVLEKIEELAKNNKKVVAIGEIGYDLYYTNETFDLQTEFFLKQLSLAEDLKLPVIIHSRDAVNQTLAVLKTNLNVPAVMHCYSYSAEMLKDFLNLGMYISISGVVTFNNAKTLKEVVKNLSLDNLLVETDCPYLTPVPLRGQTNKAHYVEYVVNEIAKIKEVDVELVKEKTTKNAKKLFNIMG